MCRDEKPRIARTAASGAFCGGLSCGHKMKRYNITFYHCDIQVLIQCGRPPPGCMNTVRVLSHLQTWWHAAPERGGALATIERFVRGIAVSWMVGKAVYKTVEEEPDAGKD